MVPVAAYRDAGADLIFVDGIKTRADLDAYASRVVREGIPALYNGALVSATEAERLGFRIQILAGAALFSAYNAVLATLRGVKQKGRLPAEPATEPGGGPGPATARITDVLGLPDVYEREHRYQVTS